MIDNAFLHDVGLLQEDPRFEKQQHQKALMPLNKKVYFHIGVCVSIEIFVGELTHLFVFGVALSTSCFLKNSSSWCFLFFIGALVATLTGVLVGTWDGAIIGTGTSCIVEDGTGPSFCKIRVHNKRCQHNANKHMYVAALKI